MLGIDYSFSRPNPNAIHAAGYGFVMRYLSPDPAKNLTKAEAEGLLNAGLAIGLVWESTAQRALGGAVAGEVDAEMAEHQAEQLGYPAPCPIWFAVDFDPSGSLPAVADYFAGVGRAKRLHPWGAYGGLALEHIDHGIWWQTCAWSGQVVHPSAIVYQRLSPTKTIVGAQAGSWDEDVLLRPAWLWSRRISDGGVLVRP